jgi:uncharacterized protein
MIIDLKTILHDPRHFDFTFEPNWWQDDDENGQILRIDAPLKCHVNISRAGSRFVFDGSLSGRIQIRCARCLESYPRALNSEFRLFFTSPPADTVQSELEIAEDDMSVDFIKGSEVDLNDIVREQIYLSLPMKPLCRENCFGLCLVCGTNLNEEKCKCQLEKGHPGFSKLRALKLDGE